MKKLLTALFILAVLVSCKNQEAETTEVEVHGLDLNNMDQTADPRNDFYRFANGKWLDNTKMPDDEGRWTGFNELRDQTNNVLLGLLNHSASESKFEDGSDEQKVINFFSVGMDSTLAEGAGIAPISHWFEKIDNIKSGTKMNEILSQLHKNGYSPFFGVSVFADLMNSKMNAFYVGADGLGLPNRDYYTKQDDKSKELREKYLQHIQRMLEMADLGNGGENAKKIMAIEMELALASKTPIEMRNIPELYNKMTKEELKKIAPDFDWDAYLAGIGLTSIETFIVTEPKFIARFNELGKTMPLENIKIYLKWNVINRASSYLNHDFVAANFDFYGKALQGTEEMKPRWERVLNNTNGVLGEALGKVYVSEVFPPEAKLEAQEMVNNILKAFEIRINQLEWMTDSTKQMALKKLSSFTVKIGYPNKWKDYAGLEVENSGEMYSYLGNIETASQFQFNENMRKINKPVDKEEWGMSPQTVNAYYNPMNNEIVFPAAILQPPFYNYKADPAVNYGGIGAVIGHEISHGFDDQGSRFDSEGNMINWWSDEDKTRFEERTALLIKQYDEFEALDSVFVQGRLTLGENIGDLGGLNAAFEGMRIYYETHEKPADIDGFTQEQRFFLSWATIWRSIYRDETLRNQILTDPHSPGMYRAVGPLTNMEQFYEAFGVREGDGMWRADSVRVKIW